MATTTVLRIETPDHVGPFHGDQLGRLFDRIAGREGLWKLDPYRAYHNKFRTWSQEPAIWGVLESYDPAFRSAFASPSQAREWFSPGMLEVLTRNGFLAVTYEVEDAEPYLIRGEQQVVFMAHKAREVGYVRPTEIQ